MKFLVGYNGSVEAKAALSLAGDFAKIFDAEVFVMASLEGGVGEKIEDITQAIDVLCYGRPIRRIEAPQVSTKLKRSDLVRIAYSQVTTIHSANKEFAVYHLHCPNIVIVTVAESG